MFVSKLLETINTDHKAEGYCPGRKKIQQSSEKKKSVNFEQKFPN